MSDISIFHLEYIVHRSSYYDHAMFKHVGSYYETWLPWYGLCMIMIMERP